MTDDGLFINNFNLANACSFDPLKNVFSLIKEKDLDYCYIQNKRQPIPEFITPQSLSLTTGILCWEWEKQPSWSD